MNSPFFLEMKYERVVTRLCKIMLQLICTDPHPALCTCRVCVYDGGICNDLVHGVCIDAFYQGYMRRKQAPITIISQACDPVWISHTADSAGSRRHTPILLGEASTARLFLQQLAGDSIFCSFGNEKYFAECLRLARKNIATQFWPYALCWRTSHDMLEYIGSSCALSKLWTFTKVIFDVSVLTFRVSKPLLQSLLQLRMKGSREALKNLALLRRVVAVRWRSSGRERDATCHQILSTCRTVGKVRDLLCIWLLECARKNKGFSGMKYLKVT